MERIEDRSKALSYIGIEIAESLKYIKNIEEPKNVEETNIKQVEQKEEKQTAENIRVADTEVLEDTSQEDAEAVFDGQEQYIQEVAPKLSLWERIKKMKLIRGIRYLMKIKVVLELPEPENNDDK